ncbi:ferredoxin [Finegoldia magna]|uniref:Ferredoxin n=1 Tax=Finegoldia magna TaxID=1260 RepID=A0A233V879_FINMA|nr:ASKHA domain-containing protein [Finegoldia magna]MDU5223992.1 ASKHA domain-containing protein [Finegoldia magna]OXZ28584.1 ferredoxin [Finegoldia magna]
MKIRINNLNRTIELEDDKSYNLMNALLENDIYIDNSCNGKLTCGKCKIKVVEGNVNEITDTEKRLLKKEEIENGIRLSCAVTMSGDVVVETLSENSSIDVLDSGDMPEFEKQYRDGYGICVDIGTTTVCMNLVDLKTGDIIAKNSALNAQTKYGLDVLTRITFEFENENAAKILQHSIVSSMNKLIDKMIVESKIDRKDIKEVDIAANTTMIHMLLGVDARSLGKFPYKPVFTEAKSVMCEDIGLNLDAKLYTLPNVSAYIGADIVAGAYVTDMRNRENTLFIDIGTNGEIVLKTNDKLYCCSCAAGPALEGMNIKCGMRAEQGAIEDVLIDGSNVKLQTIGDKPAKGICGSGILAVISEIVRNKIVNKRGRIIDPNSVDDFRKDLVRIVDNKREVMMTDELVITQSDIRQVQLAKGAILSGFIKLLDEEGLDISDLNECIVAGQFGSHLKPSSIVGVGILPYEIESKISYVGNSSLIGAYMCLMNDKIKEEMSVLAEDMNYIELSMTKDYEKIFAKAMEFPKER